MNNSFAALAALKAWRNGSMSLVLMGILVSVRLAGWSTPVGSIHLQVQRRKADLDPQIQSPDHESPVGNALRVRQPY